MIVSTVFLGGIQQKEAIPNNGRRLNIFSQNRGRSDRTRVWKRLLNAIWCKFVLMMLGFQATSMRPQVEVQRKCGTLNVIVLETTGETNVKRLSRE